VTTGEKALIALGLTVIALLQVLGVLTYLVP
jgi:hypothetical protein